jgi:hypothetical protein
MKSTLMALAAILMIVTTPAQAEDNDVSEVAAPVQAKDNDVSEVAAPVQAKDNGVSEALLVAQAIALKKIKEAQAIVTAWDIASAKAYAGSFHWPSYKDSVKVAGQWFAIGDKPQAVKDAMKIVKAGKPLLTIGGRIFLVSGVALEGYDLHKANYSPTGYFNTKVENAKNLIDLVKFWD